MGRRDSFQDLFDQLTIDFDGVSRCKGGRFLPLRVFVSPGLSLEVLIIQGSSELFLTFESLVDPHDLDEVTGHLCDGPPLLLVRLIFIGILMLLCVILQCSGHAAPS